MKRSVRSGAAVFLLLALLLASVSCVEYRQFGAGRDDVSEDGSESDVQVNGTGSGESGESEDGGKPAEITLVAAGDNLIHESVFLDAEARSGQKGVYNFAPIYEGIREVISSADIAMINQETPLAGKEYGYSGYPNFNAPREVVDTLADIGFDVFNIANNHSIDQGMSGLRSTLDYMRSREADGLLSIGAYEGESDLYTPRTVEVDGFKIGFVGFDYGYYNGQYFDPSYGIVIPSVNDVAKVKQIVSELRSKCDFLVVSAHWGGEDTFVPDASQKNAAAAMAEAGADLIIGTHSHTLQPIEWLSREDGTRALCVYSLGNLVSSQYYDRNMIGGIMSVTLTENGDGRLEITDAELKPTITHYSRDTASSNAYAISVYMMEDYTEALAAAHGCHCHSPGFSLTNAKKTVTDNIGRDFLPSFLK